MGLKRKLLRLFSEFFFYYIGVKATKYSTHPSINKILIYVCNSNNNRVYAFDVETGQYLNQFTNDKYVKGPKGLEIHPQNGQVIVTNEKTNTVTIHSGYKNYNKNNEDDKQAFGTLIKVIGDHDGVLFSTIFDVVINSKGEMIVSSAQKIDIFDSEFKLAKSFGSYGVKNGEFRNPGGVCVDKYDNILVSEF